MPAPVRLVLVHGSQVSGAQWSRYAALLGPDVDLVTPDLVGHGSRRSEAFTWEDALAVQKAALIQQNIARMTIVASRAGTVVYPTNWRGEKRTTS